MDNPGKTTANPIYGNLDEIGKPLGATYDGYLDAGIDDEDFDADDPLPPTPNEQKKAEEKAKKEYDAWERSLVFVSDLWLYKKCSEKTGKAYANFSEDLVLSVGDYQGDLEHATKEDRLSTTNYSNLLNSVKIKNTNGSISPVAQNNALESSKRTVEFIKDLKEKKPVLVPIYYLNIYPGADGVDSEEFKKNPDNFLSINVAGIEAIKEQGVRVVAIVHDYSEVKKEFAGVSALSALLDASDEILFSSNVECDLYRKENTSPKKQSFAENIGNFTNDNKTNSFRNIVAYDVRAAEKAIEEQRKKPDTEKEKEEDDDDYDLIATDDGAIDDGDGDDDAEAQKKAAAAAAAAAAKKAAEEKAREDEARAKADAAAKKAADAAKKAADAAKTKTEIDKLCDPNELSAKETKQSALKSMVESTLADAQTIIKPFDLSGSAALSSVFKGTAIKYDKISDWDENKRIYISDDVLKFEAVKDEDGKTKDKDGKAVTKEVVNGKLKDGTKRKQQISCVAKIGGADYDLPPPGLQFANFTGLCLAGKIFDDGVNATGVCFKKCTLGTADKPFDLSGLSVDVLDTLKFPECDLTHTKFPKDYVIKTSALLSTSNVYKVDDKGNKVVDHVEYKRSIIAHSHQVTDQNLYDNSTQYVGHAASGIAKSLERLFPEPSPKEPKAERVSELVKALILP